MQSIFLGVDYTIRDVPLFQSTLEPSIRLCEACLGVSLAILLFSRSRGLMRGLAIDFDQRPVAFYLFLIFLADRASFLAF